MDSDRSPSSPASLINPQSHARTVQLCRGSTPSLGNHGASPGPVSSPSARDRHSVDTVKGDDRINESSPLLTACASDDAGKLPRFPPVFSPDQNSGEWDIDSGSAEESKSSWYMFLLTISFGGLQIAWSAELSNGSPYLLSLGITKSLLAFVWIAGPLSGTLVQPYVGIRSDRCRSRFGKRRPFMVGGALATIASLIVLAWAREIVGAFLSIFGVPPQSEGTRMVTIVLAILMVYILDFSINVIQAAVRAFVVDNAPTHQQDTANAWASRMLGIGNIIGYIFGYADLPRYMWFFGDSQFKVLCVIASLALAITLTISCLTVSERDPRQEGVPSKQEVGILSFFKTLWLSMRRLPTQIQNVCLVQFAAWVAWFPFLFYVTTYVGELYVDPIFRANPGMTDQEIDDAWEHGTRMGTFALLVYAIVSFTASVVLPWFVTSSHNAPEPPFRTPLTQSPVATTRAFETPPLTPVQDHIASSDGYFGIPTAARPAGSVSALTLVSRRSVVVSWKRRCSPRGRSLEIPWLTLKRVWLCSHVMLAILMWLTFLVKDTTTAVILSGLVGIPWAITMWVPFALIAAEISKRESIRRGDIRPSPTRDGELLARGEDASDGADQAGVVLGIHNVAVAAPQVIATLVSSAIFKALQKPRGSVGDDSVAWVLRFGGILALVAAWLTRRIAEEGEPDGTGPRW